MAHAICESCETVQHCSANGCIPLVQCEGGASGQIVRIDAPVASPEDTQSWCATLVSAAVVLVVIAVGTAVYFR